MKECQPLLIGEIFMHSSRFYRKLMKEKMNRLENHSESKLKNSFKYFLTLIIVLSLPGLTTNLHASSDPWSHWDLETLKYADTASEADFMTLEERQVVLITNLARIDGPLFSSTFLKSYMEHKKPNSYTRSLTRDLNKTKGLQVLVPEKDLFDVAYGHARESGRTGHVGHKNFDKRFKPLLGKYDRVAENCAYGLESALDNVMQLLIDENIKDLGHRKNMLNPEFSSTGASIQAHKNYKYNCVIAYARKSK
jgi:uncharacterized protein YkwD